MLVVAVVVAAETLVDAVVCCATVVKLTPAAASRGEFAWLGCRIVVEGSGGAARQQRPCYHTTRVRLHVDIVVWVLDAPRPFL